MDIFYINRKNNPKIHIKPWKSSFQLSSFYKNFNEIAENKIVDILSIYKLDMANLSA